MNSFFAAVFHDLGTAETAQRRIEKLNDDRVLKLVASVVVRKDEAGKITQHHGQSPGAVGAGLGGLVGGLLGLVGGPLGSMVGVAAGALSGGWFDLLRAGEREAFLAKAVSEINAGRAALLGEVINLDDAGKQAVEAQVQELGGTIIGSDKC